MKNEIIVEALGGKIAIGEAASGRPALSIATHTEDGAYQFSGGVASVGTILDYQAADELCNWLMAWLSNEDSKNDPGDEGDYIAEDFQL